MTKKEVCDEKIHRGIIFNFQLTDWTTWDQTAPPACLHLIHLSLTLISLYFREVVVDRQLLCGSSWKQEMNNKLD